MDSHSRPYVRRERRRHYAREALGIGYQSFNVELPAWMKRSSSAATPANPESANTATSPATASELEVTGGSVWTQALMHSLVMVLVLASVLIVLMFAFRAGSLLLQLMSYKPGAI